MPAVPSLAVRVRSRLRLGGLVVLVALAAAGCSDDSSGDSTSTPTVTSKRSDRIDLTTTIPENTVPLPDPPAPGPDDAAVAQQFSPVSGGYSYQALPQADERAFRAEFAQQKKDLLAAGAVRHVLKGGAKVATVSIVRFVPGKDVEARARYLRDIATAGDFAKLNIKELASRPMAYVVSGGVTLAAFQDPEYAFFVSGKAAADVDAVATALAQAHPRPAV